MHLVRLFVYSIFTNMNYIHIIVTGSQQDLSLRHPHSFRVNPASSAFNECARKDRKPTRACRVLV